MHCSDDVGAVDADVPQTIDLSNSLDPPSQAAGPAARAASLYPVAASHAHPQVITLNRDLAIGKVHGRQNEPGIHRADAQGQLPQNGKVGSPVQQPVSQRSGAHSSKTQASHAVTLSSEGGSAIDITGEVTSSFKLPSSAFCSGIQICVEHARMQPLELHM